MTEADWGPGRRVLLPDPSETGQGAPAGIAPTHLLDEGPAHRQPDHQFPTEAD